jgi:hypothetical protein
MLLLEAQKYLDVVRKRGEARSELRRVYYILNHGINCAFTSPEFERH